MNQNTRVTIQTRQGAIVIELNDAKAPISAKNFIAYAESGHYVNTIFHRVIKGFMVQGGGLDENMRDKPTQAAIQNEANNGLKNVRGSVAMARTNDPHSATSQFFINTKDNGFLDFTSPNGSGWGYAVFAQVVEGMDVVDKIEASKTGNNGFHQDVPVEAITITSVEVHSAVVAQ